jgi:hypothetical protein
MKKLWTLAIDNPKTTLSGIMSFLMVTGAYLAGYSVLHASPLWTKIGTVASFSSGLAKVWIGLISQDRGTQLAVLPGESTPQMVPSHEQPDAPGAKPVPEAPIVPTGPVLK